jgi:hypothetical protein
MNELATTHAFDLSPRTLEEALKFADIVSKSGIVPKDFMGNPGNVFVAIQWGMELGLKPMQAMQNIAVINGRPSLWGDAVIALVRSSPLCESIYETFENGVATCRVKRRGEDEQTRTYSEEDAKKAGLIGKAGPWTQHPKRMMQMRARAFALRDVFPDVLKGMPVAEEIMDTEEKDITPKRTATAEPIRPQITTYPEADFKNNFPAWEKLIVSGKKNADQIIAMVSSKAQLTEEQANVIKSISAPIEGEYQEQAQ